MLGTFEGIVEGLNETLGKSEGTAEGLIDIEGISEGAADGLPVILGTSEGNEEGFNDSLFDTLGQSPRQIDTSASLDPLMARTSTVSVIPDPSKFTIW